MENILYFSSILLLLFLFQLCSPSLASSDYQTPTKYFVNCGSNSDVDFNGQNFVRDTFSIGRSKTIKDKNPSPNTSPLYQAARISTRPFAYESKITENGTHFVRLHFFVFKSGNTNLADAVFNVSTSTKSLLLSNFSLRNGTNSPVVKEFLLTVNGSSKFSIYFIPQGTFFAFVNAIEVFSVPNITRDDATLVTRDGKAADFSATGLHYLHTGPNGGIVHRDIKSTNILLSEHFTAKVADFGLSKSGPLDPDHFSIGIKGSFGYLDPEYLTTLQITDKSDVYSFGVVLLEVLCARPAIIDSQKIEEVNLAEWGMHWHKKGQLETIVDPSLLSEITPNSLRKFGKIVEKCLSRNGADRPTMVDVLWDLEYALQLQKAKVPRGLPEESGTQTFLELSHVGSLPSFNIINEGDDLVLLGGSSTFDPS
ncbi:hypothetical protein TIFTF001_004711 [Ficus carica]|uniref:Protein kinase domain-containing protein n=1 Tax=Ficus carica TaxID=3494 RepID=A0AA87ZLV3_FICCA|nr:hypothetical protein TIFTF001_004711 [Ficus carica]